LSRLCTVRVGPEKEIYENAKRFQNIGKLLSKDAVHLACAVHAKARAFLTCDDQLIKRAQKLNLAMEIMNPVDYVRREDK